MGKHCNFDIVRGEPLRRTASKPDFLPNEFQRLVDSLLKNISFTNYHVDDSLNCLKRFFRRAPRHP